MEISAKTKAQWCWNANEDPWDESLAPKWTPYNEEDNKIIEDAFLEEKPFALVRCYKVVFKDKVQQHKDDEFRRRPVIRQKYKNLLDESQAEGTPILLNNHTASKQLIRVLMPPLVRKWLEFEKKDHIYQINKMGKYKGDQASIEDLIRDLIDGMIAHSDLSKDFTKRGDEAFKILKERTEDIFLYFLKLFFEDKLFEEAIRKGFKNNSLGYVEDLGPICFVINYLVLICSLKTSASYYKGEVYKKLTLDEAKLYKKMHESGLDVITWNDISVLPTQIDTAESYAIIKLSSEISGACLGTLLEGKPMDQILVHAASRYIIEKFEEQGSRIIVYLNKI